MRLVVLSALLSVGLTLLAAWLFELPLARAILYAPIIVLSAGAAAFLIVLWTKVVLDSLRGWRHPRR